MGTERGLESRIVPEAGYPFRAIPVRGFPRSLSWAWVDFGISLVRGIFASRSLLRSWRPAAVVGTGGYVSVPAAWMGVLGRIPVVLLEQNCIPGLATRATARRARFVCLTYEDSARWFARKDNLRMTGNPIRRSLVKKERVEREGETVRVLVVGGSRGAHQINVLLTDALDRLPRNLPVSFVVQTGRDDRAWVEEKFAGSGFPASVHAYLEPIEDAYAAADLVICRAGATTLGELTARGLPSVLIPYPYAARRHQEANAEVLSRKGAAEVLDSASVTAEDLAGVLERLAKDGERREQMGEQAAALGRPGAADEVASLVCGLLDVA